MPWKSHENVLQCDFFFFFQFGIKRFWRRIVRILQTTVVYVAYNSVTVPSYLTEQELVQHGQKSFLFCKVPLKIFWSKLKIIAKIVEKKILLNSCPISLCRRTCFSRDWGIQTQNTLSVAASLFKPIHDCIKGKEWLILPFTECAERHPSSIVKEDFMNIACMLYQSWSHW